MDGYIHRRRKGPGSGLFSGISFGRKKTVEPQEEGYEPKRFEHKGKEPKGVEPRPFASAKDASRVKNAPATMKVTKMDDADYEELEDVDMHEETKARPEKKGGIKGFFGRFKSNRPHIEEVEEDVTEHAGGDDLPEDVKEVLKTSLKWIQELPPARLKDFRNSPDFEKYREVLVKYKVAKPTEKK